jgi:hypothetical protein
VNISEKNGYLFVSFSVAGFGRKNNLKVVTARGLKKTLQRLERELESRGVFVDIYRMKVCGIDLFLDRHMSDYSKVLNVEEKAKLPYLNKIRWVGNDNPTLYRYNNRRKVCIYPRSAGWRVSASPRGRRGVFLTAGPLKTRSSPCCDDNSAITHLLGSRPTTDHPVEACYPHFD